MMRLMCIVTCRIVRSLNLLIGRRIQVNHLLIVQYRVVIVVFEMISSSSVPGSIGSDWSAGVNTNSFSRLAMR